MNTKDKTQEGNVSIFGSKVMRQPAPAERIPQHMTRSEIAYQMVKDETFPQPQPRLNLATFVTTYMDDYGTRLMNDDVEALNTALDEYNAKTGYDIPIHIDAASGGFILPFLYPEKKWDFRLKWVYSISTSGHKYGLVYPGLGWVGKISKWGGLIGTIIPAGLLIVLGIIYIASGGHNYMDMSQGFFPDLTKFDNLVLASSIFLFYAGMEMMGVHVMDVNNPSRQRQRSDVDPGSGRFRRLSPRLHPQLHPSGTDQHGKQCGMVFGTDRRMYRDGRDPVHHLLSPQAVMARPVGRIRPFPLGEEIEQRSQKSFPATPVSYPKPMSTSILAVACI